MPSNVPRTKSRSTKSHHWVPALADLGTVAEVIMMALMAEQAKDRAQTALKNRPERREYKQLQDRLKAEQDKLRHPPAL
ncbi:hypothetical protein BCR44DRAFT_66924 [Catenaria anguillulae PL171]|uniref:Uncharacterized protein n=1 Tax=Catenaria anguillulae PL171 TaxID=765915 RepID=A0A1Y2HB10_9FUNG|nr:hypothetical protein BCR44DRAFT_66924 [Catenaria anguillulae PL171]